MEKIKLRVTGNVLEVIERPGVITSGAVGLPVEFVFDSQWDGLQKTAVFKAGDKIVTVADPEMGTVVPWEVLTLPNLFLQVGVYGAKSDGTVVIPTLWAKVAGIYTGTDPTGDPATAHTLPVWQALQAKLSNHEGDTQNPHNTSCEQIGAATQSEVRQLADVHYVKSTGVGALFYSYNFVAGHLYKVTNNTAGYVIVRTRDASGANVDEFTIGKQGDVKTFTATADAVTLYLYSTTIADVVLEDVSLRVPVAEDKIAVLEAKTDTTRDLLLTENDVFSHCVVADSAGAQYLEYKIVPGHKYRLTNNSTSYVKAKTMTHAQKSAGNGEYVDAPAELSKTGYVTTFVATGNADILQLYFGGKGSVTFEDLSFRLPGLEKRVENLQGQSELTDFKWIVGKINVGTGKDENATNRIRTGFIPVTGYGGTVVFDGVGRFIVCEYASNEVHSNLISRTGASSDWNRHTYTIQRDECKFIRIVAMNAHGSNFADQAAADELGSHFKLVQSSFKHRAVGRYVSPVKENFYYDDILEEYSSTCTLAELYKLWDDLQLAYPDVVTKTVLGTATTTKDGKVYGGEIRCYRITPPQLNSSYTISRYSCEPLKILYVSCIHGGEGAIALDDFTMFRHLIEYHKPSVLWNNCVFEIIPVANPVGYDTHNRLNGNGININRNFPYNWLEVDKDEDPYNASSTEAGDQYETQLLMNFVKSRPDAFLVMNRHGTANWADNGVAGYAASAYQSDTETIIASGMATDTMLRDMHTEFINGKNPNTCFYTAMHNEMFNGSFDGWYNSIGHHGYLLEYCDRTVDSPDEAEDIVRMMNITAIMNLLCDSVLNNRGILANNNKLPGRKLTP